jgi:predicted adenine nucleotide alpha hydrolase (AANH) superfamily ATPase
MAKEKLKKAKQYHGQRETDKRQTIAWPKRNWQKRENIMAREKLTKKNNIMAKRNYIVCLLSVFLWP